MLLLESNARGLFHTVVRYGVRTTNIASEFEFGETEPDFDNSAVRLGLISRVEMNDTVRQRNQKYNMSCEPEIGSPLPGGTRLKLASARRGLATGTTILLCLTLAACSGFFINPSISSIFITPASTTVAINGTQQLTATGTYSDGSKNTLSGSTVGWSSSDDTIATITNGGLVTGVATGTATMTATAEGVSGTANVTVTVQNLTSIVITTTQGSTNPPSMVTISGVPTTLQFYAYANGVASQDITNAVTWTSSNTNVATISSGLTSGSGLATSVATGSTVITATSPGSIGTVTSNTITLIVQ
jgi:Bacterial Ig-like domain (group 2)